MTLTLVQLTHALAAIPAPSPQWEGACTRLITQILKGRSLCRDRDNSPLETVHHQLLEATRQQLQSLIERDHCSQRLGYPTVEHWSRTLRTNAFQEALTPERLQQLALHVQTCCPRTPQWHHRVSELANALTLADCFTSRSSLNRRLSMPLSPEDYQEVKNQTLIWIAENVHAYSPEKCVFLAWINERLKWIAVEWRQAQTDPLARRAQRRVRSLKFCLKANLERVNRDSVCNWLWLCLRTEQFTTGQFSQDAQNLPVKYSPPSTVTSQRILGILSVMLVWWHTLKQTWPPTERDQLLYQIAVQSVDYPTTVVNFSDPSPARDNRNYLETLPPAHQIPTQPRPPMDVLLQQCLVNAPVDPFDECIRDRPQATFRAIALAQLDGCPWKEIADRFQIQNLSTVSTFYYRRLERHAPLLKDLLENELAIWSLHHPTVNPLN